MPKILPARPAKARNLAGVATEMIRSLGAEGDWLTPADSAVAIVVDGLGAIQLRAHAAHARHLARAMGRRQVAQTVFPSTTAAALASFLTGTWPGEHGLVGYRVLDPDRDRLVNQLNGYENDGLDPASWQRVPTVFERAERISSYSVGHAEYRTTGFTRALQRGAEFVAEDDLAERVRVACALAAQRSGTFVYCYIPELDKAGHRHGVDSDAWRETLEAIDSAIRPALDLPRGVGALVTADHGMIDVPRHRHVLLREGDPRLDGVRHLGGEPRLVHVYAHDGVEPAQLADRWRDACGASADVSTGAEAIADGLFGDSVAPHVRGRIGDVLVAARGAVAFYDDRLRNKDPQKMIGQHGSVSPEEMTVPLVRLGAYAG